MHWRGCVVKPVHQVSGGRKTAVESGFSERGEAAKAARGAQANSGFCPGYKTCGHWGKWWFFPFGHAQLYFGAHDCSEPSRQRGIQPRAWPYDRAKFSRDCFASDAYTHGVGILFVLADQSVNRRVDRTLLT